MVSVDRRGWLFGAAGAVSLAALACTPFGTGEPTPSERDQLVGREVTRIINQFFSNDQFVLDSLINNHTVFFLHSPATISHTTDERGLAFMTLKQFQYKEAEFEYAPFTPTPQDQQKRFKIALPQRPHIFFSEKWLTVDDRVKALEVERQALSARFWDSVAPEVLSDYEKRGSLTPLAQDITPRDMANSLAVAEISNRDSEWNLLYRNAPMLAIFHRVESMLLIPDSKVQKELQETGALRLYELARDRGVPIYDFRQHIGEFHDLAFTKDSPWAQMILEGYRKLQQTPSPSALSG